MANSNFPAIFVFKVIHGLISKDGKLKSYSANHRMFQLRTTLLNDRGLGVIAIQFISSFKTLRLVYPLLAALSSSIREHNTQSDKGTVIVSVSKVG